MQQPTFANWRVHTFRRDELIPLKPDTFWLLKQGAAKTLTWSEEGTIVTLGYWGPEDIIGQPLSEINPYQIRCLTPVKGACIPLNQWGWLSDAIRRSIQQTEKLLCIVRSENLQQRLLKILVLLAQKFGREVDQGQLIELRLTHQELADVIGATRVTVTRLLKQFEQEGIISRPRRHSIVVRSLFIASAL